MNILCWHGQTDTLPSVRSTAPRAGVAEVVEVVEVTLRIGLSIEGDASDPEPQVLVTVEGELTPGPGQAVTRNAREITREFVQSLLDKAAAKRGRAGAYEPARPYLDIAYHFQQTRNRYFEVKFPGLPYGATFSYTISYQVHGVVGYAGGSQPNNQTRQRHRLVLVDPRFTGDDIRWVNAPVDAHHEHWWTLSIVSDHGFTCVRLDMVTTIYDYDYDYARDYFRLPCVKLTCGHSPEIDVGVVQLDPTPMPIIDRNTDSILVCVAEPRDGESLSALSVTTGLDEKDTKTVSVDLSTATGYWPTRLMLLNYCIQGLNDLFAPALSAYTPPRTYIEVTMRDELAAYSSRPEKKEEGEADGYEYTLDAHRYYNVKSQWAFNAGVLNLMAHDTPRMLQKLQADVSTGLIAPCNAGFGAHRPSYYMEETNRRELERGEEVIRNTLRYAGQAVKTYYPDQRLFKGSQAELGAYRTCSIEYLVFDRSTVCGGPLDASTPFFQKPNDRRGNYLWTLQGENIGILLIEDQFRDQIDGASDDERLRGKLCVDLRRRFMQLVTPKGQSLPRPLMVYGDDADKASGCGWFDGGDFDGHKLHYNEKYQSGLCWISRHAWVESVTTDDLTLVRDSAQDLPITSATCPSVDPGGAVSIDAYCNPLHFDQWHAAWRDFQASWLGRSLGDLSNDLEGQLVNWSGPKGELFELAWLYFLMCTHESFWNKEPLECPEHINDHRGVLEPEDFVIAQSLEQRHAWVYLNASFWANWAAGAVSSGPFLDSGQVLTDIQAAGTARSLIAGGQDGLFWDHDLLQNVVLYNDQVLLIMDRNGGCIANIFVRQDGTPLSMSGHFKAFQYLDTTRHTRVDPGTISDGEVFQNTVLTPNHVYVGSDLNQAKPLLGTYWDPRARPGPQQDWYYPNNFNEYAYTPSGTTAVFRYQASATVPPSQLTRTTFADCCVDDRTRRVAGNQGLVWHDAPTPEFTKSIRLQDRTVHIGYANVPAGHVVGNEFCLDLFTSVLEGIRQRKQVAADRQSITLRGPRKSAVTVRPGRNCQFVPAAVIPTFDGAVANGLAGDYLALHRVLTDDLRIACPAGGDFDYVIEFS
jgi:hypothetical protein